MSTKFFVTEQEKLFYELGKMLGRMSPEEQKIFLLGLTKKLVPLEKKYGTDHEQTQSALSDQLTKNFAHAVIAADNPKDGIKQATLELLHSNKSAFFSGYNSAKTMTESMEEIKPNLNVQIKGG